MDERVLRFRVGVVVVAALTITVVLVMLFGAGPNLLQRHYLIHIRFPEAPGVTVDTPVRKSGVLIGRVTKVQLEEDGTVVVSAKIKTKYKLRRKETCRIATGSLFGDAVLQFVPSGTDELIAQFDKNGNGILEPSERAESNEVLGDADLITGVVASNPLQVLANQEQNIERTLTSISAAGDEVAHLARLVNERLGGGDGRLLGVMEKAETALDRFDQTMQALQVVLGDEELQMKLRQSLDGLPRFLEETGETMRVTRQTLKRFEAVAQKAETNLDNLESFTGPLGERGEQLVANIEASTRNLNELLAQLVAFSEAINSGQGTLGKLAHDDELYRKLDQVMTNAEDVTRRLRPILDDVRTFTDKIARDPRQLGLKGALDPRPTGLKTGFTW